MGPQEHQIPLLYDHQEQIQKFYLFDAPVKDWTGMYWAVLDCTGLYFALIGFTGL